MATSPEQMAKRIADELKTYTAEVEKGLETLKESVADEGLQQLKANSPRNKGGYVKGWRKKKDGTAFVIYNAKKANLTHLLEKGHAKRNGGRVQGTAHIQPVEEQIIKSFEEGVEKVIRQ